MYRIITIVGIVTVLGGLAPTVYAQTPQAVSTEVSVKGGVSKQRMSARELYNRGVQKHQRGNYQGAISDYTQALQLAPNNKVLQADTYFNRGAAYKELGDNQRARDDLRQASVLYRQLGNQEDYRAVQKLLTQIR